MNSLTSFAAGPENNCQGIFVSKRNYCCCLMFIVKYYPVLFVIIYICLSEVLQSCTLMNNIFKMSPIILNKRFFPKAIFIPLMKSPFNNLMERLVKRRLVCNLLLLSNIIRDWWMDWFCLASHILLVNSEALPSSVLQHQCGISALVPQTLQGNNFAGQHCKMLAVLNLWLMCSYSSSS